VRRRAFFFVSIAALMLWAVWSYSTGGIVHVLVSSSGSRGDALADVRAVLQEWGSLAPLVYTLAVVVEVIVAPIPGTLLYAPAGAVFGGLLGGTLSLIGNVFGAAICCVLGGAVGEHALAKRLDAGRLGRYRELLRQRGLWVVLLLRLNPFTSSDLVSYAAGMAGVPAWKVAAGTLVGMAPLCYAQAYFAERLFDLLPGPLAVLIVAGLIVILVCVLYFRPSYSSMQRQDRRALPDEPAGDRPGSQPEA
jgi:uncharacterized membrane protein YdjX (TVP38/TMEM64 family)